MTSLLLVLLYFQDLAFVRPTVTTFAGVTAIELKTNLAKIDILGLEIMINGEPAHYFETPPFETSIDFSKYPAGPIVIEAILEHFLSGPAVKRTIEGTNFPHYYEEEVRLVRIPVTIDFGATEQELKPTDLQLYEDGVRQEIEVLLTEEQPLDLIFLLDTSTSMARKMPFVLRGAQQMIDHLQDQDQVAVIGFNEQVYEVIRSTTDKKRVKLRLTSLESAGGTNIWGAVFAGSKILARSPMRRAIVLFTDGQHSDSGVNEAMRKSLADCMDLSLRYGVPIYAMGVATGKTQDELVQLAKNSGGQFFAMRSNRSIREAFQQIGKELRRQYLVCYNTKRKQSGTYDIEVKLANRPDAKLNYPKNINIVRKGL